MDRELPKEVRHKYSVVKTIGEGAFGVALLLLDKNTQEKVVLKIVSIKDPNNDKAAEANSEDYCRREIKALRTVVHSNIVRFIDHLEGDKTFYIFMEFCGGGTLEIEIENAKRSKSPLSNDKLIKWFGELLSAIAAMHKHKIIHRDIKPANIFLSDDKSVRLGDLGIAKIGDEANTAIGTPLYLAPEIVISIRSDKSYTDIVDEWQAGVVFYELVTLNAAFPAANLNKIYDRILKGDYQRITDKFPAWPVSAEVREVIDRLIVVDPKQRSTAAEILQTMPIFSGYADAEFGKESEALGEAVQLPVEPIATKYEVIGTVANKGQFGEANTIRNKTTNILGLLKTYNRRTLVASKSKLTKLKNMNDEYILTGSGNCKALVAMRDHFLVPPNNAYVVVMDFVRKGNLRKSLADRRNGEPFEQPQIVSVMRQLADALTFIHSKGFVHFDVTPQNIFLHDPQQCIIKLGEPGFAKRICYKELLSDSIADVAYWAPEVLLDKTEISAKCDIWSFGCVINEMIMLRGPFERHQNIENLKKAISTLAFEPVRSQRYDGGVIAVVEALLTPAASRPPTDQLVKILAALD